MSQKREWFIAGVIALTLFGAKRVIFADGKSGTPAQQQTLKSKPRLINVSRNLSEKDKSFEILGQSLSPMYAPCELWRKGNETSDSCSDERGLTYFYTADHQLIWSIKRNEKLSESITFSDIVSQLRTKYGEPSSYDYLNCQAFWGDIKHISLELESRIDCSKFEHSSTTGLSITYTLQDMDAFASTSRAVDDLKRGRASQELAGHKL